MELLGFEAELAEKRILITGHTGFTGSWARLWLDQIGAKTYGLSFENQDEISMRKLLGRKKENEFIGDVADSEFVFKVFEMVKPQKVLHLAAQPIVSTAYDQPFRTMTSNVQGTAVILEACSRVNSVESLVLVTTDKVYKNRESKKSFVESDELGGEDPYSASKTAAEYVIAGYVQAFSKMNRQLNIEVARGGNIIGGGDYSRNRIIPDLVRSIEKEMPILLRQPHSTRPWQHVLSLIHGYLLLLSRGNQIGDANYGAWNFGPALSDSREVIEIVKLFGENWILPRIEEASETFPESMFLSLNSQKAQSLLDWYPAWDFTESIKKTIEWYKQVHEDSSSALTSTYSQIRAYREALTK